MDAVFEEEGENRDDETVKEEVCEQTYTDRGDDEESTGAPLKSHGFAACHSEEVFWIFQP